MASTLGRGCTIDSEGHPSPPNAMAPPPNDTAEWVDPAAAAAAMEEASARAQHAVVVIWTLFAVGVYVTCLRTYSRIKMVGVKRLQPDDYLVWVAVVS